MLSTQIKGENGSEKIDIIQKAEKILKNDEIQQEYAFMKKELDAKLEKEGLNNMEELKSEIKKLESQLSNKNLSDDIKFIKKNKISQYSELLNLSIKYESLKLDQPLKKKKINELNQKIQKEISELGIASKEELLEEIIIITKRIENGDKEIIKNKNKEKLNKLNEIKVLYGALENIQNQEKEKVIIEGKSRTSIENSEEEKKKENGKTIKKNTRSNIFGIHISDKGTIKKKKIDEITTYEMENLKMIGLLGSGGFGNVFRVFNKKTAELMAIKYFEKQNFDEISDEDYLLSRIKSIDNQNIFLNYYGLFKDNSDKFMIIMESGEINLEEILNIRKSYKFQNILYIFRSLVEELLFLQVNGIANRDIKPANIILISQKNDLFSYKISDFGLGCVLKDKNEISIKELSGMTKKYAAPELKLIFDGKYNKKTYDPYKADVYSLGIVLLDLLKVSSLKKFISKYENHTLYNIILQMTIEDPNERVDFKTIKIFLDKLISSGNSCVQPDDEKQYITEYINRLNDEKENDERIREHLDQFNVYFNINNYKIAHDILTICYNNIYLENKNDPKIINTEIEGRLFFELGRFNHLIKQDYIKAEKFYNKSLTIRKSILGEDHKDTATSYEDFAIFYDKIKQDYKIAKEYYDKSLEIRLKLFGENHQETAKSYTNLAIYYHYVILDYLKAEEFYKKSKKIRKTNLGSTHEETAISYHNLGDFYHYIKKDYSKAEKYYNRSLDIRKQVLGANHLDIAKSYNSLGLFYHFSNVDNDKAEDYYNKSLSILENIFGDNHKDTAKSYNNLAIFYHYVKKNYDKADELYNKSLNIRKNIFKSDHEDTLNSYENLAIFNEKAKKEFIIAEEYYIKCISISEKLYEDKPQKTAKYYRFLAEFYKNSKNDYDKAEKFYDICLKILQNLDKSEVREEIAKLYISIALFYHEKKQDFIKAEDYYKKNINILEEFLGKDCIDVAKSYFLIAEFYHNAKVEQSKAEEFYIKCLNIRESLLSVSDNETKSVLNKLLIIYISKKDRSNAKKIREKLNKEKKVIGGCNSKCFIF